MNSDTVIGKLADRREDVVRFIQKARDTAEASVARREELSQRLRSPRRLPRPAAADPRDARRRRRARRRRCSPTCAPPRRSSTAWRVNLPALQQRDRGVAERASAAPRPSARSALRRGRDEIHQLAQSGEKAPQTAEILADFLRDIDDPRRAVEIDDRVTADTGRTNPRPGTKNKGYTGLEGLLNYAYYQAGAAQPVRPDRPPAPLQPLQRLQPGLAAASPAAATRRRASPASRPRAAARPPTSSKAANCVWWLGPNQPGINEDLGLPKYDPSVCPNGHASGGGRADAVQPRPASAATRAAPHGRAPTRAGRGRATAATAPPRSGRRRPGGSGGGQAPRPRRRRGPTTSSTRSSTCRPRCSTTCRRRTGCGLSGLGGRLRRSAPSGHGGGSADRRPPRLPLPVMRRDSRSRPEAGR